MTSITISKSPKHYVHNQPTIAETPENSLQLPQATPTKTHKHTLHLPRRLTPEVEALPARLPPGKTS